MVRALTLHGISLLVATSWGVLALWFLLPDEQRQGVGVSVVDCLRVCAPLLYYFLARPDAMRTDARRTSQETSNSGAQSDNSSRHARAGSNNPGTDVSSVHSVQAPRRTLDSVPNNVDTKHKTSQVNMRTRGRQATLALSTIC